MNPVRELSEKLWSGEASTTSAAAHPFAPQVVLEEVADGVAFFSGFANVGVVRTDAGLVLVDTGSWLLAPQAHAAIRAWSDAHVTTAVFTHGHVDHVMGLAPFEAEQGSRGAPRIEVVAHEAVPARFDRYLRTGGYNACINSRQFGAPIAWPTSFRAPDRLFADALDLDVGGRRLALTHARGETDDHAFAWLADRRVLFTGDLFIWASPNAGNPQKVQRYPDEWARALRRMETLGAEVLCPGHGPPIWGAERVRQALGETAELLEHLVTETLSLMNQGATLDDVLGSVKAPARLLDRPYLRPVYDEPEFVVRNVWRLYGGWWDGNPAHLSPAPEAALARELAALSGGPARLAGRARELAETGDLALACHLVELAYRASPDDAGIAATRKDVYLLRANAATSLMSKGIYRAAVGG